MLRNEQLSGWEKVEAEDPSFLDVLLSPYGLVVLCESDRVVLHQLLDAQNDVFRSATYQLWRLSDLKLPKTEYFDMEESRDAHISLEEPRRLGPDGSMFVQTLGCGTNASPR